MPYESIYSEGKLLNFHTEITVKEARELSRNPQFEVLQFNSPIKPKTWRVLENELFSIRDDVTLRAYSMDVDLSFLEEIPSLTRFSVDCMSNARNLDAIAELNNLTELGIGLFELKDFDVLERVSPNLEVLDLHHTFSKRPDISVIQRFTKLRSLYVSGHHKGFSAIGELSNLERLTLYRITKPDLQFLSNLKKLSFLDISLGGADDLSAIIQAKYLKFLSLCWIRGFSDVSFLSECPSIIRLHLDRQKPIRRLPDFSNMTNLRSLTMGPLQRLESVDEIQDAPNLEWFGFGGLGKLIPSDFKKALLAPNLQAASGGFGGKRKDEEFRLMVSELGLDTERGWNHDFDYEKAKVL